MFWGFPGLYPLQGILLQKSRTSNPTLLHTETMLLLGLLCICKDTGYSGVPSFVVLSGPAAERKMECSWFHLNPLGPPHIQA